MNNIYIKNARVNNLKSVSVNIRRNNLVVVTGVSGSGKSSLAFDTLYAEGQRRYVESLSSYARQFLDRMEKPEVDYINGISPAIAIQQQVSTSNPRSTVGTTTEIYDFLKLLYARIGKTISPLSGKIVTRDEVSDIVDYVLDQEDGSRIQIMTNVKVRSKGFSPELQLTLQKGFTRIIQDERPVFIEDLLKEKKLPDLESFQLLIDRLVLDKEDRHNLRGRLGDSILTAYQEGLGRALIKINDEEPKEFNDLFEADGMTFEQPSVNFFSFNNPYGACSTCEGFGRILGIDTDLVVPDQSMSVFEGAIAPWRGQVMGQYLEDWLEAASKTDFPIHRSYYHLTEEEQALVWNGINGAMGVNQFFQYLTGKTHKIQFRVMLARYRGYTTCPSCGGSRIREDAKYVKIDGHSITELLFLELDKLQETISSWKLDERDQKIAKRLLVEIDRRLDYLIKVGVQYLTLNRKINTLSGGEMQRIRLATSLGSGLVGSMYILDEPSIGLHSRDTDRLIAILKSLRDQGNTVIVVEHDEAVMNSANQIIDMGPGAGELGGEVVFNGVFDELLTSDSLTGQYLSGRDELVVPAHRRKSGNQIKLLGARMHNIKGVDLTLPLHALSVVTGVSGSGKTTLIQKILYPALRRSLGEPTERGGFFKELQGDLNMVERVEMVDQRPIGRSARSNPATYIKAYDHIRELFSKQQFAKIKGLKPGDFSFNIDGGRCDNCQGEGYVTVEMQFLPDVKLLCEVCHGKRFKKHVLEVQYHDKNIDDVLNLTITEALEFFQEEKKIRDKLDILVRVGLGYLRMGQSTSTLSGGEAQRMKLASFLAASSNTKNSLYIFDEPTTGLHFDDIKKLLKAMNELVERGNTILVIEHNLDVIKSADYLVDIGPEGGSGGGQILYQGPPEGLVKVKGSYTAGYLKEKL